MPPSELSVPPLAKPASAVVEMPECSVGTELRLPALVHPEVLLALMLSFGGPLLAATKWLLY